jgi:hypothetical protein
MDPSGEPVRLDSETLASLDAAARRPEVAEACDRMLVDLDRRLASAPAEPMAWEVLPLSLLGPALPPQIRSAWIFVLRAGLSGAERHRHPNSQQLTMALRGEGELQTWSGQQWTAHRLSSGGGRPVEDRWLSIPAGTWHQVATGSSNWGVLSFHTAAAQELIEERPDGNLGVAQRRHYVG